MEMEAPSDGLLKQWNKISAPYYSSIFEVYNFFILNLNFSIVTPVCLSFFLFCPRKVLASKNGEHPWIPRVYTYKDKEDLLKK